MTPHPTVVRPSDNHTSSSCPTPAASAPATTEATPNPPRVSPSRRRSPTCSTDIDERRAARGGDQTSHPVEVGTLAPAGGWASAGLAVAHESRAIHARLRTPGA